MADEQYHLRRVERDVPDRADQLVVLRSQKYLSLAMACDNQPYLVSLNYAFSEEENCFYVHSAPEGRKIEMLRANPCVWGQVIEDRGYLPGQCSHAYRSVMFEARAEFVTDLGENSLPLPIAQYRSQAPTAFKGNDKNIAVLLRYFKGLPLDFIEPTNQDRLDQR